MQNNNILEKVDEMFANFDNLDFAKIETLIKEVLAFLESLKDKLSSSDEKVKTEAVEMAQKLQQKLQLLSQKAFAKANMSQDQIAQFLSKNNSFTPDEWVRLKNMEQKMSNYEETLPKNVHEKRTKKKDWLKS